MHQFSKIVVVASIFTAIVPFTSSAQNRELYCGTDEMHQDLFKNHPEYNAGIQLANEKLQAYTKAYEKQAHDKDNALYVIPIVFHVVHNYGTENISDAQILDAIKQLNIQYRKLNSDTTDIVNAFKSIASDPQIEFRLAQKDPNGNCTSGITRTVSSLTSIGDHQVKSLIHWPPDKYLNVYICAEAAGLAGHCVMPAAADTIPDWDGIVMAHDYVGTIGTSQYFHRTVLSHEIGHYLNLQHIWGGNNVPGFYYLPCGDGGNCAFDDDVTDTPLTIGWSTCNLGGTSCGSLDNVQNYMDYAYCALMFTEGQKTRMHACLNSPVAHRNNLWSPANLLATGTDYTSFSLCRAKFEANKRIVCVGDTVWLTDVSLHGIQNRQWTVNGGEASSLTDSLITVVYNAPGKYSVSLQVTKGSESLTSSETDYITVFPATGITDGLHEPFETENHFNTYWSVVPKDAPFNWTRLTNVGFKSNESLTLQNFSTSFVGPFEFVSQPFDASALTAVTMSFDFAYAQKQTSNIEQLKVSVSNNCGETWTIRRSYNGSGTLKTVDSLVTFNFIPQDSLDWKNDVLNNIPASYLTDNLQFKFTFEAKGGNNLYIDNIRVGDPATLGLNQQIINEMKVYPNPASDKVTIEIPNGVKLEDVKVYNLFGQLIKVMKANQTNGFEMDVKDLIAGVYIVQMQTSFGVKNVRLVKE
jgi:hypothetical protein